MAHGVDLGGDEGIPPGGSAPGAVSFVDLKQEAPKRDAYAYGVK